jgi:potassium-transporting ATPase potassium-binding subunit
METLIPAVAQVAVYVLLLALVTKYLGIYMARVFQGERTLLSPVLVPVERGIYRLLRIKPSREQNWVAYTSAMLAFSAVGLLLTYLQQRVQQWLPLNPQSLGPVNPDLAFNTAASFTSNTNWQAYVPETTMSYLTNMAGLAVHNFTSAATGIVLAVALVRGFTRRETRALGNFWVDLTRCTLYILLPHTYRRGRSRTSTPTRPSTHCRAVSRQSWAGRSHHKRPSRSLARTAGAR